MYYYMGNPELSVSHKLRRNHTSSLLHILGHYLGRYPLKLGRYLGRYLLTSGRYLGTWKRVSKKVRIDVSGT